MKSGIYKITSPSGRVYIGQSRNIKKRYFDYKCKQAIKQPRLRASFMKYGFDNHIFETIINCDFEDLNHLERYYIFYYNSMSNKGLNCTVGGDATGMPISDITRQNQRNAQKGRIITKEARIKMSISHTGKKLSDITKAKLSKIHLGKPLTQEHKKKLSLAKKGVKQSEFALKINSECHKKLFLNTETGIYYIGREEAAKSIGIAGLTLRKWILNNKINMIYA